MDDRKVIEKVLGGDREAFALLVERYKDMAYTVAFRMLGDRSDAEEVVQEAFIKAYSSLGSFRQKSAFSTWFYRIVYNGVVSFLRSRKYFVSGDEQTMQAERADVPDYDDYEEKEFRKEAVLWAMSRIKPEDRAIVTLFYHEEKSLKEIGAIVGMNEDTVKMRLHRSRKKMKKLLEEKFQGELINVFF